MADSISWTDLDGSHVLSNLKPEPATRLGNWTPDVHSINHSAVGLGTGRIATFEFRRDDVVHFEIAAIPGSQLSLMKRLKYHLVNGGIVTIATTRPLASEYVTCSLQPDTIPEIDFSDRQMGEYTFTVDLKASVATAEESFPTEEDNLWWWWKAELEESYSNNDDVGTATDFSGNGFDATVPTGWKPKFRTNVTPAGGPAFEFLSVNGNGNWGGDADDDANAGEPQYLKSVKMFTPTNGATIFTVFRRINTHVENGQFWRLVGDTWNSDNRLMETHGVDGTTNEIKYAVDAATNPAICLGSVSTDWNIHCVRYESGTTARQYLNGVEIGTFDPNDHAAELVAMVLGSGADVQIAEQFGILDAIEDDRIVRRFSSLSAQHGIALA